MNANATFTEKFAALLANLAKTTDGEQVDSVLTEFCNLLAAQSLLNCFDVNSGNSYYDGVGETAELSIEMSNLLTNAYGVEVTLRVSANPSGPAVKANLRLVQMLDKLGFGSSNYRYVDEFEPEDVVVENLADIESLEEALLTPMLRTATDIVVNFAADLLGESIANSVRESVAKEIAPNMAFEA